MPNYERFVDLVDNQVIGGVKNFEGNITFNQMTPEASIHLGDVTGNASRKSALLVAFTRSTGSSNAHGITEASTFTADVGKAYASIESLAETIGSNNYDHLAAFQASAGHTGSGTLTDLRDFSASCGSDSGTVTNRKGLYIIDAGGSGTITNQYGIWIGNLTRGSSLNYAIYQAAGTAPSRLSGELELNNVLTVRTSTSTTEIAIDNTGTDGDPYLSWQLSGTRKFCLGVNDGASDVLQLGTTAIDTGTMLQATASGQITQPLQPCFSANVNTTITDQTGDNTAYTVVFDTEAYDVGSNFNSSTGVFTAPVTGKYFLGAHIRNGGVLTTHTTMSMTIVTSNRNYTVVNVFASNPFTTMTLALGHLVDMDINDTASVSIQHAGGTKVVDVIGGNSNSVFTGSLIN